MPKKRLVEVGALDRWLEKFYAANVDKKEKFIDLLAKTDPGLAKALDQWQYKFLDLLLATKKTKEKYGKDTTKVDKLIRLMKGS
jgi:hypothetical protein